MLSIAGTIGLIMTVILLGKIKRHPGPLPIVALLVMAAVEVTIVFYYMYTLEVPVP